MKDIIIKILFLLLFTSCQKITVKNNLLNISVSILPQKYFVEKIAGKKIKINVMIPPGSNPVLYEPSFQQMEELSHSMIYFRIGYIQFEKVWMNRIRSANNKMVIIDTSSGIDLIKSYHHNHTKSIDPHIWLSPSCVKIQIKHIYNALKNLNPAAQHIYLKNYNNFIQEIKQLDKDIKKILHNVKNRSFLVYHPAWAYFSRDYGLNQIAIEMEGKSLSVFQLKKIIDHAKNNNIKTIFIQEQFDSHIAQAIAEELNGQVIKINPLHENWMENMRRIALALQKTL